MKLIILVLLLTMPAVQAQEAKLGDESDGNRSIPVHVIKLYDAEGSVIWPDDRPLLPFSTRMTCGECHDYQKIRSGWHFNAGDSSVIPGRRGQPWIYVDRKTATQLPLSLRDWPGTYKPAQIGLTPFEYVELFGRHMPGGGIGEDEAKESLQYLFRWLVSGKLEINCLSCHDAEKAHDQAEFASQIARQNFRWAAAASSGFATVRGSARKMPDNYDIYFGMAPDLPDEIPPSVKYDSTRFNDRKEVFFDIARHVPAERCYFCHSTKTINEDLSQRWEADEDVHLTAGMTCVDCHRNGLDHNIVRGFEGEVQAADNPFAASLTCRGCHLGENDAEFPLAGRLGAPVPQHTGIPMVHFEKMTCTACHSGAWPVAKAGRVKTSRAHALGTHGVDKSDEAPPTILAPVFVRQEDGKIAPHKLFWPSFWGRLNGKNVEPIPPEIVAAVIDSLFAMEDTTLTMEESPRDSLADLEVSGAAPDSSPADTIAIDTTLAADSIEVAEQPPEKPLWPNWSDTQVEAVLKTLAAFDSLAGEPVYVNGGKLFRISRAGNLTTEDHPAAAAYSWAFAHDVRPASQSLGIRGCGDCHTTDAPIYFGRVDITPVSTQGPATRRMTDFQHASAVYAWIFAASFLFRPWFKIIVLAAAVILAGVVLLYAFRGLANLLAAMGGDD